MAFFKAKLRGIGVFGSRLAFLFLLWRFSCFNLFLAIFLAFLGLVWLS
jgi:hypothetical protein